MYIKPSTCLRNEYNEISALCKETMKPVYLTKNGEGDLVVMSIEAYERREEMLDLRQKLLDSEYRYLNGAKTYSFDEVNDKLTEIINGAE